MNGGAVARQRPACVRIRDVHSLCRACGKYVTVAYIARGQREAYCEPCCPICGARARREGNNAAWPVTGVIHHVRQIADRPKHPRTRPSGGGYSIASLRLVRKY
jgi:hypothetical protein